MSGKKPVSHVHKAVRKALLPTQVRSPKRKTYSLFKKRRGEGMPLTVSIVLALLLLFCAIAEFSRVWIIAQGVKEATQSAILCVINDNYDDVYHAVREGYAAGWLPSAAGWEESLDSGDVYEQLAQTLALHPDGNRYLKMIDGELEFAISDLWIDLTNNPISSGESTGFTATSEMKLEVPLRYMSTLLPPVVVTLHTAATYRPLF